MGASPLLLLVRLALISQALRTFSWGDITACVDRLVSYQWLDKAFASCCEPAMESYPEYVMSSLEISLFLFEIVN